MINIGNRTSSYPILSVIILLIKQLSLLWLQTKLDSTQSYYHYKYCLSIFLRTCTDFIYRKWQMPFPQQKRMMMMMTMMKKEVTCQSTTLMMRYNLTKTCKPLYLFQQCHDVIFINFLSLLTCWFSLQKLYNKPLFSEFQKLSLSK